MASSTGHQPTSTFLRLEDIRLKFVHQINFNESVRIKDCCSLPDGKMIFADFNNRRLLVCNLDDRSCQHIPTGKGPYGLTVIDSNTVAVSCSIDKMVQTINITTGVVKNTIINTRYCCHGLSYNRGNLYVLVQYLGIEVNDVDGNYIRNINVNVPTDNGYLCCCSEGFYYTGTSYIAYYHVDDTKCWTSREGNRGVTVYNTGNIFVTNSDNSSLFVMSAHVRNHSKCLLSRRSRFDGPGSVFYNKENNTLLVVTRTDRTAVLYRVV